ncbi:MAG: NfeD family protein [Methylobacter sp.]|uniref:NfeD family protein n=1 Tax=Methylobacter sp. TaxID=2051955 RepID=UPI0025843141|nr:NfeD family protein [Methylobacter sp.]MCL7422208.1 NfeD family protein [Methylobacter sp.]
MAELEFVFWHWWILALILLVVEILVPGFFFVWLAIAGFITGCLLWLLPSISMDVQLAVFSVLSVLAIVAWQFYARKHPTVSDQPLLNRRGAQYIGRVFNLYEPIVNGQGKIKVDDSIWKVHGEDCDINTKVKVTAIRGTVFDVEKVE